MDIVAAVEEEVDVEAGKVMEGERGHVFAHVLSYGRAHEVDVSTSKSRV